jgi:isoamylase
LISERASRTLAPGSAAELGVHVDGKAANFALFSAHAEAVELCLFSEFDEETRIPLQRRDHGVWSVRVSDVSAGQRYGYRVHGPWDPSRGLLFNPAKLLLDPYARAIAGTVDWAGPVYGFQTPSSVDLLIDSQDDAAWKPRGIVIDNAFDWAEDRSPRTPWPDTVIYEAHAKGLTKLHPAVPVAIRGTYAGLAHPAVIEHFHRLGVTAVELLPVHAFVDDAMLVRQGLKNYWGYNTLGFFAPEARYSELGDGGGQVVAFKQMVKGLHKAGIEVLLDVVYNHTAESGDLGPTLSFRGIDNPSYYHLTREQPRRSLDWTGTGNTVQVSNPDVLRMVMDSLRYWVREMHVDGFRFDLASALARDEHGFSERAAFFAAIHQDPILANVKLIAEPWDLGEGGYRTGAFPRRWSEWNDRYRDTVRGFWLGKHHRLSDLGLRLSGSADLFRNAGRTPSASINFVTAHDGFTLRDLVSYQRKHNHANGEDNRDGSDHNSSNNYGVEGPSTDPSVRATRIRQRKNLLATLLLSLGVPMILGGDELGRTQGGNNNAYSQDNEVSWVDWELDADDERFLAFVERLTALRRALRPVRRNDHPTGEHRDGLIGPDLSWFRFDGAEMRWNDWIDPTAPAFGFRLFGAAEDDLRRCDGGLQGCYVALNAGESDLELTLPPTPAGCEAEWEPALSTVESEPASGVAPARSVTVFVLRSIP